MASDPPFGRLARSVLTFPWAMSMLGVQQILNLAAPTGPVKAATGALDAMTRATHESPRDWWQDAWHVVRALRRAVAEVSRERPK